MSRPLKSLLFVPILREKLVRKAALSNADAVILDLEDATPPDQKPQARAALHDAVEILVEGGKPVAVRVNRPLIDCVSDIKAVLKTRAAAIVLPKTENRAHIELVVELLSDLGQGDLPVIPLVETASAIAHLDEIAAHPNVISVAYGDEDLAADLGCGVNSPTLTQLKTPLIVACARAGIPAMGLIGSIAEFKDLDAFARSCAQARDCGLKGTLCIHPNQVDIANRVFRPTEAELAHARAVLEAFDAANANGEAVATLDGKMIDAPIVKRARQILAQA